MKQFLTKLIGGGTGVSSKRVSAIFILLNLVAMSWFATIHSDAKITPEFMFDALTWLAAAGFGFTSIEKLFDKNKTKPNA